MIQSNAIQYQGNINSFINLYQDILAVVFAIPRAVFGVQIKETGNAVLTLSTKVSLYWQNLKNFQCNDFNRSLFILRFDGLQ